MKVDLSRNTSRARTLTNKAIKHLSVGQIEHAEPLLVKAIKADRRYAPAHNNMGLVHFDNNDLFRAALSFQEAMRFDPQSPEPQNNLGLTFEAAGRTLAAIEHYQAAHELAPTDAEYLGNLVRARLRSGETAFEMRNELQQLLFIERRPDWIEWIEDQLELFTNPNLDRGPETPDLDQLTERNRRTEDFDESDRVIYDSGLADPQPSSEPPSSGSYPAAEPRTMAPQMPLQPVPEYGTPAPEIPSAPMGSIPLRRNGVQPVANWSETAGEWAEPLRR